MKRQDFQLNLFGLLTKFDEFRGFYVKCQGYSMEALLTEIERNSNILWADHRDPTSHFDYNTVGVVFHQKLKEIKPTLTQDSNELNKLYTGFHREGIHSPNKEVLPQELVEICAYIFPK